jgi:hypothetical protein
MANPKDPCKPRSKIPESSQLMKKYKSIEVIPQTRDFRARADRQTPKTLAKVEQ